MFQDKLMAGQRILVTGGGTGLGRAMAERFLSLGADVAICGRRKSVCDETAATWRAQFPQARIDTFGVDIRVDAFNKTFPGRVNSVQAGSGTAFSLLPAENATGNYVKVVQRVPVKITFDQRPDIELGPGMSVVPTVTVRP